jgi:hypothetical protein
MDAQVGLSRQRVHQIAEATQGSRSWRGDRAGSGELLSCSFCGRRQQQVTKLIARAVAHDESAAVASRQALGNRCRPTACATPPPASAAAHAR